MTPTPPGLVGRDRPLAELEALAALGVDAGLQDAGRTVGAGSDARLGAGARPGAGGRHGRKERDAIAYELAAALGLGGRDRGLGDPAERARKAVTERIRYSMARVARVHPELAAHLEASVTTGSSCAYVPAEAVTWLT